MQQQTNPINAANPSQSAVVKASAGVGKTYLLVTRLIRLLLNGVKPDAILAITFTRKAAAEMQSRLAERLFEFVCCDDEELRKKLTDIGIDPDAETHQRARQLYERIMKLENSVRTTTFHAFCQDILRRFPMEADVPPAFELMENTASLAADAWEALYAEATLAPDDELAKHLENLFDQCGGLANTQSSLQDFLDHRSDWLAFTQGQSDAIGFARDTLRSQLDIDENESPLKSYFNRLAKSQLEAFIELLNRHPNKGNNEAAQNTLRALDEELGNEERLAALWDVFFTKSGSARKRESSDTLKKKMTPEGAAQFIDIHNDFVYSLELFKEQLNKHKTFDLCSSWYFAGQRLIDLFQRLKLEQRMLDFSDLEWKAYELLHHSNNATWVQYKLDQRIEHLLIDEFQDTNPTQWQLLLPLLQELAGQEDGRSVFIVGDDKQSIYAFRRAEPQLLEESAQWIEKNMGASRYPMDRSRRSAPAIMDAVNLAFTTEENEKPLLNDFHPHSTFNESLWGKVSLLPLIDGDEKHDADESGLFRNPLLHPRVVDEDTRHYREGQAVAGQIQQMLQQNALIGEGNSTRPLEYGDFMLLLRTRSHAEQYELALRELNIPYISANRANLLEALEINDLIFLLDILQAPLNNVALATVLRSPIFNCDDTDLMAIAAIEGNTSWYEKLILLVEEKLSSNKLSQAYSKLEEWRQLSRYLPTHDLLDHIYFDANIIKRYQNATPAHMRQQVVANLNTFINMALEVDSGRYPSVGRFLASLEELKQHGASAETEKGENTNAVRMMTIHGSKGLEAPIVFILDATASRSAAKPYRAIINWPVENEKPQHFILVGRKENQDALTKNLLLIEQARFTQEDQNLLYVALTRARQHLYVSGCRPNRNPEKLGWYGQLEQRFDATPVIETNQMPSEYTGKEKPPVEDLVIDPRMSQAFAKPEKRTDASPSQQLEDSEYHDEQGRNRGIAIHRMIELLTETAPIEKHDVLIQTGSELGLPVDNKMLTECFDEALSTVQNDEFSEFFDGTNYLEAFNELPLQFKQGGHWINGIIDRLIVKDERVIILDYKTHRIKGGEIPQKTEEYRGQMQSYRRGIEQLWPDKKIDIVLLFTHPKQIANVN